MVAFLGPNGAGKSTTIDMLLGLTPPDAGTATVFGRPREAVAGGMVGAMLQAGALLPDVTVGELVRAYAALHRRPMPVAEALDRAGIADLAKRPTTKLSGGQVQRVRFALALVPDPDLLVLDEPTVAMDVEVRRAFWASMREFTTAGRTVLFATHYLEEADEYADRVIVLAGGRIVADGTGAAIKAQVSGRTMPPSLPRAAPTSCAGCRGCCRSTRPAAVGSCAAPIPTPPCAHCWRRIRVHDIEVTAAGLEDAFLQIVAAPARRTPLRSDPADRPRTKEPVMTATMTVRYAQLSARTAIRNVRFLVLTVALPVVLYLVYPASIEGQTMDDATGYSINAYLMVSMAAFGGIGAALNATARIAIERQTGWNRQLRLTALTPAGYVTAKIAVAMAAVPAGDRAGLPRRRPGRQRPAERRSVDRQRAGALARVDPVRGAGSGDRLLRDRRLDPAAGDARLPRLQPARWSVVPGGVDGDPGCRTSPG